MIKRFIIASNNDGKVNEFKMMFSNIGIDVVSLRDMSINIKIEENGKTFEDNAYIKAKTIFDLTHLPVIADDSGLEVDYLNGEPGIYSARYAGESSTDKDNIQKLLLKLDNVSENKRTAKFVCAIVCIIPINNDSFDVLKSVGECKGRISFKPCGENGFGYDSIFMVGDKSFAELNYEEKNKISHRGRAMKTFEIKIKEKLI